MTRPVFDLVTVPLKDVARAWQKVMEESDIPPDISDSVRQCARALEEFAVRCDALEFITGGELAKRKDVSRSAVYQWARAGKIETYELGGRKFFLDGEVKNG